MGNAHICTVCNGTGFLPIRIRKFNRLADSKLYEENRPCPYCTDGVVNEV